MKLQKRNEILLISIFLHGGENAPPYTSLELAWTLLNDQLWMPLL